MVLGCSARGFALAVFVTLPTFGQDAVTPLVRAAALGPIAEMRTLIEQGTDVNSRSAGAVTPLMAATSDIGKVRLLLEKGADVNAVSQRNTAPVTLAARLPGGSEVARLLIAKGAKVPAAAVRAALSRGDVALARELIAAGGPLEPAMLGNASNSASADAVRLVLEKFPDAAKAATTGQTPLMRAAFHGPPESVRLLLAHGADVNAKDGRSRTPLMFAAGGDGANRATIRMLLAKGADPKAKDVREETALDMALYRGKADVIKALGGDPARRTVLKAPHGDASPLKESLQRAVNLLDAAGPAFFKANGCISCHNQSIPQMAAAAVRERGVTPGEKAAKDQVRSVMATWSPHREALWQTDPSVIGGTVATMSYGLIGLAAEGQPRTELLELVSAALARLQYPDGHWFSRDVRHPLGSSPAKYTALTIRALRAYTPPGLETEFAERLGRAVSYLEKSNENDNQSLSFRILGLQWANANLPLRQKLGAELKKRQLRDGGWAQQREMSADAYATGQAVWALHEGLGLGAGDSAYARGAAWLRSSQKADGSWHVKSRGYGFQPYRETGFPHGHDQWLSAAATGFAVLALAPMLER